MVSSLTPNCQTPAASRAPDFGTLLWVPKPAELGPSGPSATTTPPSGEAIPLMLGFEVQHPPHPEASHQDTGFTLETDQLKDKMIRQILVQR